MKNHSIKLFYSVLIAYVASIVINYLTSGDIAQLWFIIAFTILFSTLVILIPIVSKVSVAYGYLAMLGIVGPVLFYLFVINLDNPDYEPVSDQMLVGHMSVSYPMGGIMTTKVPLEDLPLYIGQAAKGKEVKIVDLKVDLDIDD